MSHLIDDLRNWWYGRNKKEEGDTVEQVTNELTERKVLLINVAESVPFDQWETYSNKYFCVRNDIGTITLTSTAISFSSKDLIMEFVEHSEKTLALYYELVENLKESRDKLMLHSLYEFQNEYLNPQNVQLLPEKKKPKGRKPKKLA
jgi:hypothetical protein